MTRHCHTTIVAAGLMCWFAADASAFGWRWSSPPAYRMVYYPSVLYCVPVGMTAAPARMTAVPAKIYATPTPAPPSGTPPGARPKTTLEPPLVKPVPKGPTVIESRFGGAAMTDADKAAPLERCRVGFWNVTGREVTLTIDGKTQTLPRDRAVTLELGRSFVWRIDRLEPQSETIPKDRNTHEIVLRQ